MAAMNRYLINYDQRDEDTGRWQHHEAGVWEATTWQDAIHSWKDDNRPTNRILSETPYPDGKSGSITLLSAHADYPRNSHNSYTNRSINNTRHKKPKGATSHF